MHCINQLQQRIYFWWELLLFTCSVASDSLQPMDYNTSGFLVLHHLPEFAQTYIHYVNDAIQPSYPLSPPFSPCPQSFPASGSFPMSQVFASGGQSIGASASVLPIEYSGLMFFQRSNLVVRKLALWISKVPIMTTDVLTSFGQVGLLSQKRAQDRTMVFKHKISWNPCRGYTLKLFR